MQNPGTGVGNVAVHSDPDILSGTLVFVGTRVPVAIIAASVAEGNTLEELQRAYPFLTQAHLDVAQAACRVNGGGRL